MIRRLLISPSLLIAAMIYDVRVRYALPVIALVGLVAAGLLVVWLLM